MSRARLPHGQYRRAIPRTKGSLPLVLAGVAGTLAVAGFINAGLARRAERHFPPVGNFLEIDGVRLHYVVRGSGKPLVLIHGMGSLIQDFVSSGLVDEAARDHRVIVIDRPGYGYSTRPRNRVWTAQAQADLLHKALSQLGVKGATVLGHSWGAGVALALARRHPEDVGALVLAAGYYYPTRRLDALALSGPAIPVLGDVMRYTVSPLLARLFWPQIMRKIFGPPRMPAKFRGFPKEMALRPSQIRAAAADSGLLMPAAAENRHGYRDLRVPTFILHGTADRLISPVRQARRLHAEISDSRIHLIPGAGHMIHQTDTSAVLSAIREASAAAGRAEE